MKKTARLIKYLASKDERMAYRAKESAKIQKEAEKNIKEPVVKKPKVKKEKVPVEKASTAKKAGGSEKKKGGRKSG